MGLCVDYRIKNSEVQLSMLREGKSLLLSIINYYLNMGLYDYEITEMKLHFTIFKI